MEYRRNNGRKTGNSTNTWKINKIFLSNQLVKEKITRKIRKYFEINEGKNSTFENLWDAAKAALEGILYWQMANAYIKKIRKASNQQPNFKP